MRSFRRQTILVLVLLLVCEAVCAQTGKIETGSLILSGLPKIGGKAVSLRRKRFYLFRGDRLANKSLIDRLKAESATSRECFYCQLNASQAFIKWLKDGGANCESVYCREITDEDIAKVDEFQAAYQKGLQSYKKKPELAKKWLVTNLEPGLRSGFYDARKTLVNDLRKDIVQTAMTVNNRPAPAYFLNIPLKQTDEKFIFTNLVPIETGGKSYVWVCEAEISKGAESRANLEDPASEADGKKCDVIVRELPVCNAGKCVKK